MADEIEKVELKEAELEKVTGGDGPPQPKWCNNCQHHYYPSSNGCCSNCGKPF